MPQDPRGHMSGMYGQTGAGVAHTQILPATILQPWANQPCKKGAGLAPPENMTLAVCPIMESAELACFHKCCQLCKHCGHHSKGLLTFQSPTRRAVPKYVFHSFCSIKSPSMSDLFSMQIVFAQLGKY